MLKPLKFLWFRKFVPRLHPFRESYQQVKSCPVWDVFHVARSGFSVKRFDQPGFNAVLDRPGNRRGRFFIQVKAASEGGIIDLPSLNEGETSGNVSSRTTDILESSSYWTTRIAFLRTVGNVDSLYAKRTAPRFVMELDGGAGSCLFMRRP